MPIYEYRCSHCGHRLDVLQKLSEAPLRSCPECRHDTLAKQVSAAGFQLKGSGWYATDFRNGSKPAKVNGANAEAKGAEAKTESKSESKTESPGESKSETGAPAAGCGANCACH
jgi:putative FmdB family regulatory protein